MILAAPISTPRVGCSAIKTLGIFLHSLATTIFCIFPPDKLPTFVSTPEHLIEYCLTKFFASFEISLFLSMDFLDKLGESYSLDIKFSLTLALLATPFNILSSGI